jgi:hypothetical protein
MGTNKGKAQDQPSQNDMHLPSLPGSSWLDSVLAPGSRHLPCCPPFHPRHRHLASTLERPSVSPAGNPSLSPSRLRGVTRPLASVRLILRHGRPTRALGSQDSRAESRLSSSFPTLSHPGSVRAGRACLAEVSVSAAL